MSKLWYALMTDNDDADWGTGTFALEEAIEKAKQWRNSRYPDAFIAVIVEDCTPICVEEIREFD